MAYVVKKRIDSSQAKDKRTLQRLRREAGFKSAKDFAAFLGIPESTYSRYEQIADGPNSRIPMKIAWVMADVFGCSIDLVVGREDIDAGEHSIQFLYDHLSKSSQQRFDEYIEFLQYRDRENGYGAKKIAISNK